ncbi:MAG: DoxX family protein [Campylobacter sp.]|nr:DoxX family protein [Campylobacter sp.]
MMRIFNQPDFGLFWLRLGLGVMLMAHGIFKLTNGIIGIKEILKSHALPEFLAYGVFLGEIIAPAMIILGIYSRLASAVVLVNSIAILYLAHLGKLFAFTNRGGFVVEEVYLYIAMALCLIFSGSGKFAIKAD